MPILTGFTQESNKNGTMNYNKYFDMLKKRHAAHFVPSGVTKETYIRLIAKCLSEYGKVNDLRTATPDSVFP